MITILYHIDPENKETELEWLRNQKIFPATQDYFDWSKQKTFVRFGLIVSPEQALTVKIRHKLDKQVAYKQR
jgi:hypothetical protein